MAVTIDATSAIESRAQIERILQSKVFRTSEVLRHLFGYLADKSLDGTSESLKEYTIGLDALGKPASFDPRQESVVRMHTARLRQKLAEYYRTEGVDDPVIVEMPKGGFKITFEPRPQAAVAAPLPIPEQPLAVPQESGRQWRRREVFLVGALVVAIGCATFFMTRLWRVEQGDGSSPSSVTWTPALKQLWEPLLSSSRRLVVCVSTPLFVNLPGFGVVREPSINDWDDVPASRRLSNLEGSLQAGISEPSYNYTETGTATGAFLLGQFLGPRKQSVLITRANVLSWPEIAEDNVVFLGPATGVHQTEDLPTEAQLVLDPTGIRNLSPRPGESAFMQDHPAEGGAESGVSYALISRVPAMNGPGAILMLAGNQTASVMGGVQAFTNPALAQMLVSRLKTPSGTIPRYFQVVLSVKAMDDVPVKIDYLFHRELPDRVGHSGSK
ncbi:MAG TPA: hypothetical protein VHY84_05505 [Bryobacteraceae bacterium]|jgi:hypothetical protein|nr:hypothetical protein [Bryobacteraceae bacterium]